MIRTSWTEFFFSHKWVGHDKLSSMEFFFSNAKCLGLISEIEEYVLINYFLLFPIDFNEFLVVMEATANAIDIILNRLDSQTEDKDEPDTLMEELDSNMLTFLYLVVIFGKLGGGEMDIFKAMKVIHRVVGDIKPKSYQTGKTLLHLAVDSDTPVNDFHTSDVVQFPCAKTTKLLIEAGIGKNNLQIFFIFHIF